MLCGVMSPETERERERETTKICHSTRATHVQKNTWRRRRHGRAGQGRRRAGRQHGKACLSVAVDARIRATTTCTHPGCRKGPCGTAWDCRRGQWRWALSSRCARGGGGGGAAGQVCAQGNGGWHARRLLTCPPHMPSISIVVCGVNVLKICADATSVMQPRSLGSHDVDDWLLSKIV